MRVLQTLNPVRIHKYSRNWSGTRSLFNGNKWVKQKEGCAPGVLTSTIELPTVTGITVPEYVFQNLNKWENSTFIKSGDTGQQYTFGEVYKQCQGFAAALIKSGYKRNDSICILLPSLPEIPTIALGIMMAGGVHAPINPAFNKDQIIHQVNEYQGKVIITTPQLASFVESIRPSCPSLTGKTIVVGAPTQNCHTFSEMVKADTFGVDFLKGSQIDTENYTCALANTSGTTGHPKSIQHTHGSITHGITQMSHPEFSFFEMNMGENTQDKIVSYLPLYHTVALTMSLFPAMVKGVLFHTLNQFHPIAYLNAILEQRPNTLLMAPPIVNYLLTDPMVKPEALANCRAILVSGAPAGKEILNRFQEKFGTHIFLQEGFAMTEIMVATFVPKQMKSKIFGSCGVPTPGTTCKVVHFETGETLRSNQLGEVCVQTSAAMKGYLNNEKATSETIREDGFVYTGDLGYYDEQGLFYIVDRSKNLMNVGGKLISPSEIEFVLRQHPRITDVAVVGISHPDMGEVPRAFVIPKNDELTEEDVVNYLIPLVSPNLQLKGGVEFIQEIPKTISGKLRKRDLLMEYNRKQKAASVN